MENLNSQPFLLSLRQVLKQTGNTDEYRALLQKQQSLFKIYVQECCNPDLPAQERFLFLKTVHHELSGIHKKYTRKIRKIDVNLHHYWSMMIKDTRSFVSIANETLYFPAICPLASETIYH
jgi:hypothetical protein